MDKKIENPDILHGPLSLCQLSTGSINYQLINLLFAMQMPDIQVTVIIQSQGSSLRCGRAIRTLSKLPPKTQVPNHSVSKSLENKQETKIEVKTQYELTRDSYFASLEKKSESGSMGTFIQILDALGNQRFYDAIGARTQSLCVGTVIDTIIGYIWTPGHSENQVQAFAKCVHCQIQVIGHTKYSEQRMTQTFITQQQSITHTVSKMFRLMRINQINDMIREFIQPFEQWIIGSLDQRFNALTKLRQKNPILFPRLPPEKPPHIDIFNHVVPVPHDESVFLPCHSVVCRDLCRKENLHTIVEYEKQLLKRIQVKELNSKKKKEREEKERKVRDREFNRELKGYEHFGRKTCRPYDY